MRVLLAIPHVFAPKDGSLYSSQTESKRATKRLALEQATLGNLHRHGGTHWIHASLGKGKAVVTRALATQGGAEITIQLYTPADASLAGEINTDPRLELVDPQVTDPTQVPLVASRRLLEQAQDYDLVGYLEDDLLIEDPQFFAKLLYLDRNSDGSFAFLPHRCEHIPGKGDVILSGDPDGGRPDLFWDTGEELRIPWPLGDVAFYRATNPHSGCYFLSRRQAMRVAHYWQERQWQSDFQLSGPLEQAGSGLLLPVLKIMKTRPADYRFLMVRHQDELWRRHPMETANHG
ncbi:hypothetical protein [Cyanobium sp. WAJ14-Wanaka]|uniref:hypothetical protein n=1 Tax=Cyanobium sp. WAJ14-Wanaka TaxID=2823725 RepID=UPI0020CDC9D2|nr:hypothetical protein [Cyanobium sp. WAJ14-Wanaka]MCP9775693.1 hypothetical protein [Cyanobium sp. WAJ14-Wanaka]